MNEWETHFDNEYEHIQKNSTELEYQLSLINDELADIYAINFRDRIKCGQLLMQAIENQIREEATYLAKQRAEK